MKQNKVSTLTIYFLLIGLFLSITLQAQQRQRPDNPPMQPDSSQIVKMVDHLSKSLSLTEEQSTEVARLHFAHFNEMKAQKEKIEAAREKNRQEMENLKGNFQDEIKALLTDEQKEEFDEFIKSHGPKQRPDKPRGNSREN